MDSCSDKHFADMLYPYELDLLPEEQRQQFEIHLLECVYCNQRARRFADAAKIITRDPEMQQTVRHLAEQDTKSIAETSPIEQPHAGRRRIWSAIVPPLMAAADRSR